MKKIKCYITFLLILSIYSGLAQNTNRVLSILEIRNDKPAAVNKARIVDINGSLEIRISKDELIKKVKLIYPEFGNHLELQKKIDQLNRALEDQEHLYSLLGQEIRNAVDDSSLNDAFLSFMNKIGKVPSFVTQYNNLSIEWDKKYGDDDPIKVPSEFYILKGFNANLMDLSKSLENYEGQKFDISLLAYLKNKQGGDRVHIENFDTYAEREFYKVPRWVTNISDSQRNQLDSIKKKTQALNEEAAGVFQNLKTDINKYLPDLTCVKNIKTELKKILSDPFVIKNPTHALAANTNALIIKLTEFMDLIAKARDDISSWNISKAFEVFDKIKNIVSLKNDLTSLIPTFEKSSASVPVVKTKATGLKDCLSTIEEGVNAITSLIALLNNQQNRYIANREIGKEVIRFSIDNLPEKGFINLAGSGNRVNGDIIEIELALLSPDSVSNNKKEPAKRVVEKSNLNLQLTGLRSETAVGIIMGDSFNENGFTPRSDRRFLYAPSAALLLKVGSRKSKAYNDFIDCGFGLAISTPDFNTDGTPEFATGLMFTAFKNILNVGINYNVTLDTPFWSFGVNLPFNLPGVPINSPK